ncbi:hypothetical protein [Nocardia sp. NPDC020380]|uniref:hypothetical protein n=1 Tax=Nocardia sp. NPDC020380 TaxID=3364309 RepID=UPI00378F2B93
MSDAYEQMKRLRAQRERQAAADAEQSADVEADRKVNLDRCLAEVANVLRLERVRPRPLYRFSHMTKAGLFSGSAKQILTDTSLDGWLICAPTSISTGWMPRVVLDTNGNLWYGSYVGPKPDRRGLTRGAGWQVSEIVGRVHLPGMSDGGPLPESLLQIVSWNANFPPIPFIGGY